MNRGIKLLIGGGWHEPTAIFLVASSGKDAAAKIGHQNATMVELLGLLMAALAILFSVYWSKTQQQQSATKSSASKVGGQEAAVELKKQMQQTKQQQPRQKSANTANKKKTKSQKVPSDAVYKKIRWPL